MNASDRAGVHPIRRVRNYIESWRLSRAMWRDPEWRRQMAESDEAWRDFVARGCPEDELTTLDELKRKWNL